MLCAFHKLPAVIGRDADADVQLVDPWVSHRHCEIDQIGEVLVVVISIPKMVFSCTAIGCVNRRFCREKTHRSQDRNHRALPWNDASGD